MSVSITPSSLLEAALDYARRGWPVFPCSPKNKKPLVPRDRDANGDPIKGTGGLSKATTDEDQIRTWWKKWPRAMIGVTVGDAGMLVVDFDPRIDEKTGEEWTLEGLKADTEAQIGCELPQTLAVRTPSGGVHVYFKMPDGAAIGNKGSLPRHVDVRGVGGYTIVPPSYCDGDEKNATGPYRWLRGDAGANVAAMPAALEAALRATSTGRAREVASAPSSGRFEVDLDDTHRKYALSALDAELRELEATPEGGGRWGGRNQGIYHAALKLGGLFKAGAISEAMVRGGLEAVIRAMPNNRDLAGALKTMENGFETASPRDLSSVAQNARGRGSGRSSSTPGPSGGGTRDLPPIESYADEAFPAPAPDGVQQVQPFQNGTGQSSPATGGRGDRLRVQPDVDIDRRCGLFALTDLGNAERFRTRHGWRFRFCVELGWFVWDDRRWELLSEEKDKVPWQVSFAVYETVRAIRNEAAAIKASGLREDAPDDVSRLDRIVRWKGAGDNKVPVYLSEELLAHAKSSEGSSRLGCVANLAKALAGVAIRADAMDADPLAVNVLNGTLRVTQTGKRFVLVDGKLKPITIGDRWGIAIADHRPDDLISKIANVVFDPAAICPVYDGFLVVVQPDNGMRRFLHQWGGLSLTGDISEQKLAFFHGKGRNGKSTLVDAWSYIAGDYGGSVGIETFLDQGKGRKGGEATPDLARLPGVRFLRTSEPEKGAKLAEALIKLVTGGELIDARFLNKGFFSFRPSFKLTISGNHKPKITGHDDGIWRRVMLVPWAVQIDADKVDRALPDKLRLEASGILNRLLEGLLDQRENGLIQPEAVTAATDKYREQSDQLGRFLTECTRPVEGARSKSSELFALFTAWSKANGAAEWQQMGFTAAMQDRGFEKKASNGMQWLDVEMTKMVGDFAEGDDGQDEGSRWRPRPDDDDIPL